MIPRTPLKSLASFISTSTPFKHLLSIGSRKEVVTEYSETGEELQTSAVLWGNGSKPAPRRVVDALEAEMDHLTNGSGEEHAEDSDSEGGNVSDYNDSQRGRNTQSAGQPTEQRQSQRQKAQQGIEKEKEAIRELKGGSVPASQAGHGPSTRVDFTLSGAVAEFQRLQGKDFLLPKFDGKVAQLKKVETFTDSAAPMLRALLEFGEHASELIRGQASALTSCRNVLTSCHDRIEDLEKEVQNLKLERAQNVGNMHSQITEPPLSQSSTLPLPPLPSLLLADVEAPFQTLGRKAKGPKAKSVVEKAKDEANARDEAAFLEAGTYNAHAIDKRLKKVEDQVQELAAAAAAAEKMEKKMETMDTKIERKSVESEAIKAQMMLLFTKTADISSIFPRTESEKADEEVERLKLALLSRLYNVPKDLESPDKLVAHMVKCGHEAKVPQDVLDSLSLTIQKVFPGKDLGHVNMVIKFDSDAARDAFKTNVRLLLKSEGIGSAPERTARASRRQKAIAELRKEAIAANKTVQFCDNRLSISNGIVPLEVIAAKSTELQGLLKSHRPSGAATRRH